jgi:LemA protein
MSRTGKVLAVVVVVALIIAVIFGGTYNGFTTSYENVQEKESAVEVAMQRRVDLIPNLVATVKSETHHETEVFTALADARKAYDSAETVDEKSKANEQVSEALRQFNVYVENYPELQSSEQYATLMDQLKGSENRISVARDAYNEEARKYNVKIKRFPGNLVAGMFGFESVSYFEADSGAEKAPDVSNLFGEEGGTNAQ